MDKRRDTNGVPEKQTKASLAASACTFIDYVHAGPETAC
jgi:hypothetical protein